MIEIMHYKNIYLYKDKIYENYFIENRKDLLASESISDFKEAKKRFFKLAKEQIA